MTCEFMNINHHCEKIAIKFFIWNDSYVATCKDHYEIWKSNGLQERIVEVSESEYLAHVILES